MDLIRRAVSLNEATWHLSIPYTYNIIGRHTPEKIAARTKIGEMASEILDDVSADLLKAGMVRYLEYLGWTEQEAIHMLEGPKVAPVGPPGN